MRASRRPGRQSRAGRTGLRCRRPLVRSENRDHSANRRTGPVRLAPRLGSPRRESRNSRGPIRTICPRPDGRIGWWAAGDRDGPAEQNKTFEIKLNAVGAVRGRVVDRNGQPIAGTIIAPVMIGRSEVSGSGDSFVLSREAVASYRTLTLADGSFVLKDIPHGTRVQASFEAPGLGWLHFFWETSRPVTFTFDSRVSRIKGRITVANGQDPPGSLSVMVRLWESPVVSAARSYQTHFHRSVAVASDGSFEMTDMPPGQYAFEVENSQMLRSISLASRM